MIHLADGITIDANGLVEYRGERRGHIAYLSPRNAINETVLDSWDKWLGRQPRVRRA